MKTNTNFENTKKNKIKHSLIYMYKYVPTSDWKILKLILVWQCSKDLARNDYLFDESLRSSVDTPGQLQIYIISDY